MKNFAIIIKILGMNGYEAEEKSVTKSTGEKRALVVKCGNVSPCFYPDEYDQSETEIALGIINTLENMQMPEIDTGVFTDWQSAKDHLMLRVRRITNADIPKEIMFDRIEVYVSVVFGRSAAMVTNKLLDVWGVTKEKVFDIARKRTAQQMSIVSVGDMLGFDSAIGLFALTSKEQMYGASMIAVPATLQKAAKEIGAKRMIVIPSSIHEILLMDVGYIDDPSSIVSVVKEVNQSVVDPEEQLADVAFLYDSISKKLAVID